jgi:hypothetical protein
MPGVDCVRQEDYRYPFQSFPGRLLYAGHLSDGQQVLVGPYPPDTLVLRFAQSGELVAVERHALPELRDRTDLERAVVAHFDRTGATKGLILMRRFCSWEPGSLFAGIKDANDLRCHVRIEIVDLPCDDMESAERQRWLSSGAYILDWGDSYYVGEDGLVFST